MLTKLIQAGTELLDRNIGQSFTIPAPRRADTLDSTYKISGSFADNRWTIKENGTTVDSELKPRRLTKGAPRLSMTFHNDNYGMVKVSGTERSIFSSKEMLDFVDDILSNKTDKHGLSIHGQKNGQKALAKFLVRNDRSLRRVSPPVAVPA